MKKGLGTVASPESYKETISISGTDLPAIKNWKLGKEYQVSMKVKLTSLSQDEFEKGTRARFEVQSAQECDCEMESPKEESAEAKKAREISEKNKAKRRI